VIDIRWNWSSARKNCVRSEKSLLDGSIEHRTWPLVAGRVPSTTPLNRLKRLAPSFAPSLRANRVHQVHSNVTAGGPKSRSLSNVHLNIEDYVAAGYRRDTAKQYIETLSRV
jgi:hypothetical protein